MFLRGFFVILDVMQIDEKHLKKFILDSGLIKPDDIENSEKKAGVVLSNKHKQGITKRGYWPFVFPNK